MGFVKDRFEKRSSTFGYTDGELLKIFGMDPQSMDNRRLGESTYFICLKHLSECVGKLSFEVSTRDVLKGREKIDSPLLRILNLEPNPYMPASSFWQAVELNRNDTGNSYVYKEIQKNGKNAGEVVGLWILPSDQVQVYIDDKGLFGQYNNLVYVWVDARTGKRYKFFKDEILHFRTSVSFDGIMGLAVKEILKTQIDANKHGQSYVSNLFKNNMQGSKILLQYTGDLTKTGKDALVLETERYCNTVGTGKFLPMPLGIEAKMLEMKLTDAQFVEINKMSSLSIAAAFGIGPNVINDYSKSSYANSAAQQLAFYVNSLQPILKMYNEVNSIGLLSSVQKEKNTRVEFRTKDLFKLDPVAHMEYLNKGVQAFMYTPNEAREELDLAYSPEENASKLIGNGNMIGLADIGKQYGNTNS